MIQQYRDSGKEPCNVVMNNNSYMKLKMEMVNIYGVWNFPIGDEACIMGLPILIQPSLPDNFIKIVRE